MLAAEYHMVTLHHTVPEMVEDKWPMVSGSSSLETAVVAANERFDSHVYSPYDFDDHRLKVEVYFLWDGPEDPSLRSLKLVVPGMIARKNDRELVGFDRKRGILSMFADKTLYFIQY